NQRSRERSPPHRLALRLSRWILEPCPRHRLGPRPLIELRRARSRPHPAVLPAQRSRLAPPLALRLGRGVPGRCPLRRLALRSSRLILELCPRRRLAPPPSIGLRREQSRPHQRVLPSSRWILAPCPLHRSAPPPSSRRSPDRCLPRRMQP